MFEGVVGNIFVDDVISGVVIFEIGGMELDIFIIVKYDKKLNFI